MATPEASAPPPLSISLNQTEMDAIFICLLKSTDGSPLPSNVLVLSPYEYDPENLPRDVWFLISSKVETDTERGVWKIKEEAREVFSNSDIIGWRATREFYYGKVPEDQCKTDYVMEVFSITMKRLDEKNEKKETSSLCRVNLVALPPAISGNATVNHLTPPIDLDANSSSSRVNKHDEVESLAAADRIPSPERRGEDRFEMDRFAGGDFLELNDLDNAAQSSSSSDNSSAAMSISSDKSFDECFDALAFLQELDDPVLEQKDSAEKLDVFTANRPDECVLVPAALGSVVSLEESDSDESLKSTANSTPTSAPKSKDVNNDVTKHAPRDEGPSSSRKPSESRTATAGGRKGGGMKDLRKYFCFMGF